ncbi:hypothetical protein [Streptomyces clavuligerus]|uniref:hypothetical protein n=1 Tax=Streptomyces clavuligerus TaxID=1901 RepID=UPI00020D9572|nr:hypothetical protein [Streptomyces clavuligerus]ANW20677.1 hypothetical protein BB341_21935 [Streptomyces clavuligerus]AXU15303.1 hypothetical protein D1794_22815 [Streptomyces clavuligerus]MBY6305389.1 hypothetical protein [Streptomyces clavuligerus]QCS08079.1 hypothetical protein CRV15_22180 [Streptomyces clavuligerus]QPJ92581.1 hypothetical protein GE265_05920 [Streptomyces clavuligerus]
MDETLSGLIDLAAADPEVVGLVLSGSRVHSGMVTDRSDHDVHVILRDDHGPRPQGALSARRSARLDLLVMTLGEFRRRALPGDAYAWLRYAYVHARVVYDGLDGGIARVLDAKRVRRPGEARALVADHLDAYINQVHRSLKSFRDGRDVLGHLDAAESVGPALEVLFALHERVRPYNKYLVWEVERAPLGPPQWAARRLLRTVRQILADGDPATQRALFGDIERAARAAGHGPVLDAWGSDLELLRPVEGRGAGPDR